MKLFLLNSICTFVVILIIVSVFLSTPAPARSADSCNWMYAKAYQLTLDADGVEATRSKLVQGHGTDVSGYTNVKGDMAKTWATMYLACREASR